MTNLIPMPGYLILDITPPKAMTESGIVLPEDAPLKGNEAVVLAFGKPKPITTAMVEGNVEIDRIKVGDKVIYREFGGQNYEEGESKLLICKEDDLLAVIR